MLKSIEIPTSKPEYYTELTVSATKFTINKQFTVDCKIVATDQNQKDSEVYRVAYYKENEELATYEQQNNETKLIFTYKNTKILNETLTVSAGNNKLQTEYQINVKPLTKNATGKYSCVAATRTTKDKIYKQSIESNVQQVNNSARWALPSILFMLVNLAFFCIFKKTL